MGVGLGGRQLHRAGAPHTPVWPVGPCGLLEEAQVPISMATGVVVSLVTKAGLTEGREVRGLCPLLAHTWHTRAGVALWQRHSDPGPSSHGDRGS